MSEQDATPELPAKLVEETVNDCSSEEDRLRVKRVLTGQDDIRLDRNLVAEDGAGVPEDFYAMLKEMTIPERIKLALLGNKSVRTILLREGHAKIPILVLQNPKITVEEVQDLVKNTMLDKNVYREIARNRGWMKNYAIQFGLVSNPKVPIDITLKYVSYLRERDLRRLSKTKTIPQVIAQQCRKALERRRLQSR